MKHEDKVVAYVGGMAVAFALVVGGLVATAHPHTEPDRREVRVHKIRGPESDYDAGLYHLPDFGVCFVSQWADRSRWAVPVPCPWEKQAQTPVEKK
jgi:hypothetical protein